MGNRGFHPPRTVIHCDWSIDPRKRWAATAHVAADGRSFLDAPRPTTPGELLAAAADASPLIGFDFPIGVPAAYASVAGIASFPMVLPSLGTGRWASFFHPAASRSEIHVGRPFYPRAPGGTSRSHIVEALGLSSTEDLYRACEKADGRRACPLFWTLGGNQVGKGALSGWKEFLQPAREKLDVQLWPFDGPLDALLARGGAVVVETYPGNVYLDVGAALPTVANAEGKLESGKRRRASRAASAEGILRHARAAGVELSATLVDQLRDGFGKGREGEDMFDAVVGALGMLAVLRGERAPGDPSVPAVHAVEGWILGRSASAD